MTKSIATTVLAVSALATSALAANSVQGEYIEARTADVFTGACFANSEVGSVGQLAVMGWRVGKGSFNGVNLDGLSVVGVLKASNTLGDVHTSAYPVKSVLIVDERANVEQRLALQAFAKRMGGDLLQDVVKVTYAPVDFQIEENNVHNATAKLTAGSLATIETRALGKKDHICSNEEVWYLPLTKVGHAMPAYTLAHNYKGDGLGGTWSSPDKRSAFVATFQLND
ncbi:MAG: DUF1326 domain-containing protein [Bryobacterales bacterium]|nr:DUF1326 domain-containing protein [Bryobacterales bacterium]